MTDKPKKTPEDRDIPSLDAIGAATAAFKHCLALIDAELHRCSVAIHVGGEVARGHTMVMSRARRMACAVEAMIERLKEDRELAMRMHQDRAGELGLETLVKEVTAAEANRNGAC